MLALICLARTQRARPRYTGVVDDQKKISKYSQLLFAWHLELPDGQVKVAELKVQANNAFDRGVHLPSGWAELCAALPEVATSQRFTISAAREAAKGATDRAKHKLDSACTSVLCRRFLLHSLLSTCRFFYCFVQHVCLPCALPFASLVVFCPGTIEVHEHRRRQ